MHFLFSSLGVSFINQLLMLYIPCVSPTWIHAILLGFYCSPLRVWGSAEKLINCSVRCSGDFTSDRKYLPHVSLLQFNLYCPSFSLGLLVLVKITACFWYSFMGLGPGRESGTSMYSSWSCLGRNVRFLLVATSFYSLT